MAKDSEKAKDVTKNSWQDDIENRRYYYDDAYGYEVYDLAEDIQEAFDEVSNEKGQPENVDDSDLV